MVLSTYRKACVKVVRPAWQVSLLAEEAEIDGSQANSKSVGSVGGYCYMNIKTLVFTQM